MKQHQLSTKLFDNRRFHFLSDSRTAAWGLWLFILALWVFSLGSFSLRDMTDIGLISVFPPAIVLAYILVLFGFAYSLASSKADERLLVSYILLLVLMIHGTPQILYDTVRYSWAWKHVGIVDYIIRHGSVNPNIAVLDVYHNWPGFFALSALFTQLANLPGADVFAGWGPAFFESLFAIGLLCLFRLFTRNEKLPYLAVWFFVLTNWIGQDYFSPQATSFFLLIGVLVMVFSRFSFSESRAWIFLRDKLRSAKKMAKPIHAVREWVVSLKVTNLPQEDGISPFQRSGLAALILVCFFVIVSSHQLSPMMGAEFLIAFVLVGYVRWRTLPIWVGVLIAFWLLGPAKPYNSEVTDSIFSAFGQVSGNINSGLIDVVQVSAGQAFVSLMGRGLTVFVGVLGLAGTLRRLLHRNLDLPALLLFGLPVLMAFVNSYGGELIFRVYFFSLPGLVFLAAGLFLPDETSDFKMVNLWLTTLVSAALLVGFLFAYLGKDNQYYFTKQEVAAAKYLYSHASPNSLLIEGSRAYPSQFLNYEYFTYIPLDREPADSQDDFLNNPVSVFYRWMSNSEYAGSYMIITRSQKISADTLGSLPRGSLEKIEQELRASDAFDIAFSNEDAVIFVVKPQE